MFRLKSCLQRRPINVVNNWTNASLWRLGTRLSFKNEQTTPAQRLDSTVWRRLWRHAMDRTMDNTVSVQQGQALDDTTQPKWSMARGTKRIHFAAKNACQTWHLRNTCHKVSLFSISNSSSAIKLTHIETALNIVIEVWWIVFMNDKSKRCFLLVCHLYTVCLRSLSFYL